jgi:hypothetical protein
LSTKNLTWTDLRSNPGIPDKIVIIIIIIGSTALGGPWPPQANVASDIYPGHPPANFNNPVSYVFFYPFNPSLFRSATSSLTSIICP